MLFESHLRHVICQLIIEAKVDVLAARYPHIPVHTLDALAALDPSPTKKYLEWMVKVVDSGETNDLEELDSLIKQFDKAQQRLQDKDINSYTFEHLKTTLNDIGTQSKTQQRQTAKALGSQQVGTVDGWGVYFITSHEAAMLLGKGTTWCITQKNGRDWDDYVRDVKFFYAIRKVPQGDPLDKIAYACYLTSDRIKVFDAQDKSISVKNKSIIKLTNFINHIKNSYNTYTVTSKNQTLEVINNEWSGCVTDDYGNKEWYLNNELHREDGPAIENVDGSKEWWVLGKQHREDGPAAEDRWGKEWWLNGKLHRIDGPAQEKENGDKKWYINGKLHREDGPAIEEVNGDKEWWLKGKRHRKDGPAVESKFFGKEWWVNGKRHRKDGPAVEGTSGNKEWWVNGERHREGGPAIEYTGDYKYSEWWLNGVRYTKKDYPKALKQLGK